MATSERVPRARARPLSARPSGATRRTSDEPSDDVTPVIPRPLRVAAALGWRGLVVVAALYVIGTAFGYLAEVVIPLAIALLLSALLVPAVTWLHRRGVPRSLATALVLIGGLAAIGGLLYFVVMTFVDGAPALAAQLTTSVDAVINWLTNGPLHLSEQQLRTLQNEALAVVTSNQQNVTTGAISTATTVGRVLTEMALTIFTVVFFLYDGHGIWQFLLKAVPQGVRNRVDVAGRRGLAALVSYVRATVVVATVDAVAVGVGLAVLRVPLAIPLAALVFLGAFIPIVGAVIAGGVSVLIALAANGPITALIVLAILVGVAQLEGHVLQPLLLGRAVKLHPLAIAVAIATGLVLAGIIGALLAVPIAAVVWVVFKAMREELETPSPDDGQAAPTDEPASAPAAG